MSTLPSASTSGDQAQDAPRPDLKRAAIEGLRWTSVARMTVEVLLLSSMVVLARLIPPAEFGPYAVAIVVQELALGIQSQGVGNALVQSAEAGREYLQAGQALALISGLLLAGLTLLAAPLVAAPIFGEPTASLVTLSAPLCVVAALSIVPTSTLRRKLRFRRLAVIDMISNLLRATVSIGLAAVGLGAKSLVLGTLAATLAGSIIAWASAPPPLPRLRRRPARALLDYGFPASLASISWVCFRNCDYVIVGARLGITPAGLYYRAYQLAVEYQKKISDLMITVAFPVLARTSGADELSAFRARMVRLLTVLLFPLLTVLAIVAPEFIPWLLGSAWEPAVVPTQILALGGAATLVMDTAGVTLAAVGRSRALLGFGVAHFLVYGTAVWFVARLGITAVAIAAAVVHTAFLVVSYVVMLSRSPDPPVRRLIADIAPATVASLVLAAIAAPANMALSSAHVTVPLQIFAVAAAGLSGYLLMLRVAFPKDWLELGTSLRRILPVERLRRSNRHPSLVGANSATG
jgi:lipopolysaccharide exporter